MEAFTLSLPRRYEKPQATDVGAAYEYTPDYVSAVINDYMESDNRRYMDTAERYYHNMNDILGQKRWVVGRNSENEPTTVESRVLSNSHIVHNYFRKLTHQKISYLLSRPFSFQPDTQDMERCRAFFRELNERYTLETYDMIKLAARDSIVDGIGWLYVYYEGSELKFKHIPASEVIPIWNDIDHKDLRSAIRKYEVKEYGSEGFNRVTHIDYYTARGVIKYRLTGDVIRGDMLEVVEPLSPYFGIRAEEGGDTVGAAWTDIPFIPFKYDSDEYSLLRRIKSMVDDYDRKTSDVANAISDIPNAVTVIKNYDGASKEEFVHNKNQYRTIFVQGDGDAKALDTPLNIEEIDIHLKRLRDDIYSFGQGVNIGDKDIQDTSGVALRFLYGDLDMDCAEWGEQLSWSIYLMNWFISRDVLLKTGIDYGDVNYSVIYNISAIVNQSEVINNVVQSSGIISTKTLLSNHPWVLDADEEMQQLEEDERRQVERIEEEMQAEADAMRGEDESSSGNGTDNGSSENDGNESTS